MSDLISREDMIDTVTRYCNQYDLRELLADIEVLPSAERVGKWITKPNIYGVVYCSECDFELHINNTNYCPNCGARMER